MKSATIAAAVLASAAMAQPHGHHRRHHHHDKRDMVVEWATEYETVTVIVDETGTETVFPSQTAAATPSSSGNPGEFFQAPSSSTFATSTTPVVVAPSPSSTTQEAAAPEPTASSTTPVAVPTTTSAAPVEPITTAPAPVEPTTAAPAPVEPTTTAAAPPAATTSASSSGGSSGGSSKSGKMTYYQLGMGSCGYDDGGADETKNIVAMGHTFWNSISTLTSYGVNMPANPLCDQEITIKASNGNSAVGVIRDLCPGCEGDGIDVSEKLFTELMGSTDAGKVDVTWSFNSGKW